MRYNINPVHIRHTTYVMVIFSPLPGTSLMFQWKLRNSAKIKDLILEKSLGLIALPTQNICKLVPISKWYPLNPIMICDHIFKPIIKIVFHITSVDYFSKLFFNFRFNTFKKFYHTRLIFCINLQILFNIGIWHFKPLFLHRYVQFIDYNLTATSYSSFANACTF